MDHVIGCQSTPLLIATTLPNGDTCPVCVYKLEKLLKL